MPIDAKLREKFSQKRNVSVGVFDLGFADLADDGAIVALIPPGAIITAVRCIQKTTANAGAEVVVTAGGTTIVDDGVVSTNSNLTTVLVDLTSGGPLIFKAGTVAPSAGTFKFLVEYIEYNKTNGEYTNH